MSNVRVQPGILAIETSQRRGSVAVSDAQGSVHEEALRSEQRRSDDLMPAINRLCTAARVQRSDLHAVAVSIGPGGFTGLRIATATAQVLAETLGLKAVAVPSALVAAEALTDETGPLLIALASKRDSAWITRVERDVAGRWRIVSNPGLHSADSLSLDAIATVVADEFFPEPMRQRAGAVNLRIIPPTFSAVACLRQAQLAIEEGRMVRLGELLPLYPREPEAVRVWRAR